MLLTIHIVLRVNCAVVIGLSLFAYVNFAGLLYTQDLDPSGYYIHRSMLPQVCLFFDKVNDIWMYTTSCMSFMIHLRFSTKSLLQSYEAHIYAVLLNCSFHHLVNTEHSVYDSVVTSELMSLFTYSCSSPVCNIFSPEALELNFYWFYFSTSGWSSVISQDSFFYFFKN